MIFVMTDSESGVKEKFEAASLEEARKIAIKWTKDGDYNEVESTLFLQTYLSWIDEDGDECEETINVNLDPNPPRCESDQEHDWQSLEWLGGLKENPGVWGNGGGVIIKEACLNCGCEKTTNTWAQNPSNGQQGLTSISFQEGKYSEKTCQNS
jgi:hypothetical protein